MAELEVGSVVARAKLETGQFKAGIKQMSGELNAFAGLAKKAFAGLAVGLSAGAIINGINKSVEAFRQQDIAIKTLNQSLKNSGVYSYEYSQQLQTLASEIQQFSNYGDEAIIKAVGLGQAMAGNTRFTNESVKAIVDFAAAMNMDLDSAFRLVGKSISSNTNALARYGIELDKGMSSEQKMAAITQQLGNRFGGSAKEMANASVQLKNALGDLSEAIGAIFNPAVEKAQKWIIKWAKSVTDFINQIRIANSEIKNLGISELQDKLRQVWVAQDKYNTALQKTNENNLHARQYLKTELQKYNEQEQAIMKRINLLKSQEKAEEDLSKSRVSGNKNEGINSGINEALSEYQNFVDRYKQATNEYNATLKARKEVEELYGPSDSLWLQGNKSALINAYKEYELSKIEIAQSAAANKNELLKLAEIKLQQDLQAIDLQYADDTQAKTLELISGFQDKRKQLEIDEQAYQNAGGFLGSLGAGFEERLNIERNYLTQKEELYNTHFNTMAEKENAFNELEKTRTAELHQAQLNQYRQMGSDIVGIFEGTFTQMLTNSGSFSDNMKQLMLNLSEYLIKQALQEALTIENLEHIKQAAYMATYVIKTLLTRGTAAAVPSAHSGHTFLPTSKHHYGGSILPQADQTEHFALLKNNERVLSPAETSAYNNNEGSASSNYVVYSPVVKAMDSKDVAQWFNENKQQVLSIVSSGIKNNEGQLRTQIQGV